MLEKIYAIFITSYRVHKHTVDCQVLMVAHAYVTQCYLKALHVVPFSTPPSISS